MTEINVSFYNVYKNSSDISPVTKTNNEINDEFERRMSDYPSLKDGYKEAKQNWFVLQIKQKWFMWKIKQN